MSRRTLPAIFRAALIASLSGLMSLASCDLAGDEGGPGPSPGIVGSLPPGPLPTPFALDNIRATIGLAATQANSHSFYPSLSGDGRYVVFHSQADNLVSADLNGSQDIFLRDTQLGVTKLVSRATSGAPANSSSFHPFISNDGRFIVYSSVATNLDEITPDTNGDADIYLFDRDPDGDSLFFDEVGAGADPDGAPTTERVSLQDGGTAEAAGGSTRPSISNDGDVVLFLSYSGNLAPGDTNGQTDAYVRIRSTDSTVRISYEPGPIPGFPNGPDNVADGSNLNGSVFSAVVAGDGGFAVYMTTASDAVYFDSNGYYDVFRVNLSNLAVDRVSLGQGSTIPNSYCYTNYFQGGARSISDDGMLVSFSTSATNIVPNDFNNQYDVFIRDFNSGTVTRVMAPGGVEPNSFTFDGRFTSNGDRVSFISSASNMGPDGNFIQDVFVKDLASGGVALISQNTNGTPSNDYCEIGVISADGSTAAFTSYANNLVDDDTNNGYDIFRRDIAGGETTRVSLPSGASEANGDSQNAFIAGSAPVVVFQSNASNLVADDTNGATDVFINDGIAQTVKLVSANVFDASSNGASSSPTCSSDGRFVAFDSLASDLVNDDTNGFRDIFVRDMAAGQTFRISRDPAGGDSNGDSFRPWISADGRFVAFESDADNLISSDANFLRDIFLHDRQTGITTRVSVATGDVEQVTGDCLFASVSADGRHVVFMSDASDLVASDSNVVFDVFVHDTATLTTTRISVDSAGIEGNADSFFARISGNGRFVVFLSAADNLVGGDVAGFIDVFVRDRDPNGNGLDGPDGSTVRVNVSTAGVEANTSTVSIPSISHNGRFVAFATDADNLVPDSNFSTDVFVRDRDPNGNGFDGTDVSTVRVSVDSTGAEATNGPSIDPSISSDGRWVGFSSLANNLAFPDVTGQFDIFIRGPLY